MKKLAFLITVVFLNSTFVFSQGCLPEGITFSNQIQINNFQANYPGCTEIEGDVTIDGSGISNLNGLHEITAIGGSLSITNCQTLVHLSGLQELKSVGGSVIIGQNNSLNSLMGLEALTSITGDLLLRFNPLLENLTALESLTSIGGYLRVHENDMLWNLTGLQQLVFIGTNLRIESNNNLLDLTGLEGLTSIEGDIWIYNNQSLISIEGFQNVTAIGGKIQIQYNNLLPNLNGLENLINIDGHLLISNNAILSDLTALENLSFVGGKLEINGNNSLSSLAGLESVTFVGGELGIYNSDALTSLTGLENIASAGSLEIGRNESLSNLTGLAGLTTVNGEMSIFKNDNLTSLSGLEGVTTIGGSLSIGRYGGNPVLTSLNGLENIDATSISEIFICQNHALTNCGILSLCDYLASPIASVNIYDNAPGCNNPAEASQNCPIATDCLPYGNYYFCYQYEIDNFSLNYPGCTELAGTVKISGDDISNLNGLTSITSIGGDLIITENSSLTNLTGLEGLTSLGGTLLINSNPGLISLSGLESLTSISGNLEVSLNSTLTSLTGIDNISAQSVANLTIYCNSSLSTCEVQSVCDYLASPNGDIKIECNASGCTNPEEVETACETLSLEENSINQDFSISPNPSSGRFTIDFILDFQSSVKFVVCNSMGQIVEILLDETLSPGFHQLNWNAGNLPEGIYFYQMQAGNLLKTGKMILME
jgi:acyl-[acyl carrier protein]--UDP-N-acetylglucosamine O-acyltransferase